MIKALKKKSEKKFTRSRIQLFGFQPQFYIAPKAAAKKPAAKHIAVK